MFDNLRLNDDSSFGIESSKIFNTYEMICQTNRPGQECYFMGKNGCRFGDIGCLPVVPGCLGCERAVLGRDGQYFCTASPSPSIKWRNGPCNLATHLKLSEKTEARKINPLKASKEREYMLNGLLQNPTLVGDRAWEMIDKIEIGQ